MKKRHIVHSMLALALFFMSVGIFMPKNALAMKEGVFIYLGTADKSLCQKISNRSEHICLSFQPKNDPQAKLYLWASDHRYKTYELKTGIDLLVGYKHDAQKNYLMAAIPNPEKAEARTMQAVFLGEDNDAPSSGYFTFKLPDGSQETYRCLDDFCGEMHKYINKNVEFVVKSTVFYHEGGENFMSQDWIQSFKPIQ